MANVPQVSAGLVPIDNSTGATTNSFYVSAGLVPNDSGGGPGPSVGAPVLAERNLVLEGFILA